MPSLSTILASAYLSHASLVCQDSALCILGIVVCLFVCGWFFNNKICFTHILSLATPDTTPSRAQEKFDVSWKQIC